jgi:hypothetical protein
MKIKDLPKPKTRVKLTLKSNPEFSLIGIIFSHYKVPPENYGVMDSWRVAFQSEGQPKSEMKSFSVRAIAKCEMIE